MKIYEMTATFGKLQHQTLTLKPGLNIIEAPNEWGKTTWCAFLCAILYGLDTRSKTTKTALADREHYQPWSGNPMSGRISLRWLSRDITIERTTKGRIPMGEFRAYETASGLPVPELTGENCGEMLLGIEQSVFRRAGFIRLADLPVTGNEELSRRLNALVTTGDESGDGERLAGSLKELKNRCRYNKNGALPQSEAERDRVWQALEEQKNLQQRYEKQSKRLQEAERWISLLTNHLDHLRCSRAQEDGKRVAQAREDWNRARAALQRMEGICGELPAQEEAVFRLRRLREFSEQWTRVQNQARMLPPETRLAAPPEAFRDMAPEEAQAMAAADAAKWKRLQGSSVVLGVLVAVLFWAMAGMLILAGVMEYVPKTFTMPAAGVLGLMGLLALLICLLQAKTKGKTKAALSKKYGNEDPDRWVAEAAGYGQAMQSYQQNVVQNRGLRQELQRRIEELKKEQQSLCGNQSFRETGKVWQDVLRCWQDLDACKETEERTRKHLEDLEALVKAPAVPSGVDTLTNSQEETEALLSQVREESLRLRTRLGQLQGRMDAMGDPQKLQQRHALIQGRIRRLEDIYRAVTIAQANLEAASAELQRRFAPRLSARAQELISRMTGGRYCRMTMGEDFNLGTGASQEDTLHSILWRSEGTADQLYLSLRLAVSEALSAEAPLILDDALVRFDDERLEKAMEILLEESEKKQVVLFTCQHREQQILARIQQRNTAV